MRTGVGIALTSLLLSAFACGGDSSGSDSALNYVLAYETQIVVLDMAAMSEDTVPGSLGDWHAGCPHRSGYSASNPRTWIRW